MKNLLKSVGKKLVRFSVNTLGVGRYEIERMLPIPEPFPVKEETIFPVHLCFKMAETFFLQSNPREMIPLNGDYPKPRENEKIILYGKLMFHDNHFMGYKIGYFDSNGELKIEDNLNGGAFHAMEWQTLPIPNRNSSFDLQEPPPIKKFEVGKYYMHSGGGSMFVCGFCQTETWGTCLVAEELGGGLRPVAADDPVATQGWREVSVEEFHHPGFRVRDFPPTMGTKTE